MSESDATPLTLPEFEPMDPHVLRLLRERSLPQRTRIAAETIEQVIEGQACRLRQEHPAWSDEQVRAEIIWRAHGIRL